jgi:uncharacterized surface protein with fasciclin (FAS1) repeats
MYFVVLFFEAGQVLSFHTAVYSCFGSQKPTNHVGVADLAACHLSAALLQLLAPTDDAFDAMLLNLGGGQQKLPLDQLLRLPQLKNILLYHIVPGEYTSSEWLLLRGLSQSVAACSVA